MRNLIAYLALVLAGASIMLSAYLFTSLASEGAERRDQSCRIFEGEHLADVQRLRRTYEYLDRLPGSEAGSNLTREILRGLPQLEDEARKDRAPEFCDAPGVGLPEPDPALPERRDFSHLLRK